MELGVEMQIEDFDRWAGTFLLMLSLLLLLLLLLVGMCPALRCTAMRCDAMRTPPCSWRSEGAGFRRFSAGKTHG